MRVSAVSFCRHTINFRGEQLIPQEKHTNTNKNHRKNTMKRNIRILYKITLCVMFASGLSATTFANNTTMKEKCSLCSGTGKFMCADCYGQGKWTQFYMGRANTAICAKCRGTGKTTCEYCGGTGIKDDARFQAVFAQKQAVLNANQARLNANQVMLDANQARIDARSAAMTGGGSSSRSSTSKSISSCSLCNGTGQMMGDDTTDYTGRGYVSTWCSICQASKQPHSHKKCISCGGRGMN